MKLFEEKIEFFMNLGAILSDSARFDMIEFMLKNVEVVLKVLHDIHDYWAEIQYIMIFMITVNSTHFTDEFFVASTAHLSQRESVQSTKL